MRNISEQTIFSPGFLISNRYEVMEKIGSGGMGTVLRVVDRALDNEVIALKLLFPHMAGDKTAFARFRNEVLLTRKLAHPNIVRVYDFGDAGDGYFFITMEYVDGQSLGERLSSSKNNGSEQLSFPECVKVIYDVCSALAYAHHMEFVHRDLKPDNILFYKSGKVKLTDFGLARSLEADSGLTNTGETVGTPYYMAPEQLRGQAIDHRTDIYAMGILAYEMVVGERPFVHDNYMGLAAMHLNTPIPNFVTKNSDIPRWFQNFVEICAEKKPKDRYQSMAEVAEILCYQMSDLGLAPCVYADHFCPLLKKNSARKKSGFLSSLFHRG